MPRKPYRNGSIAHFVDAFGWYALACAFVGNIALAVAGVAALGYAIEHGIALVTGGRP